MAETLILVARDPAAQAVALAGSELTIGRASGSDLKLPGPEVSRRHARIIASEEGYILEDLGSTNGTFLNGRRITREAIKPGDEIRIGRTTLTVHRLRDLPLDQSARAFALGEEMRRRGRLREAVLAYERGLTARPHDHERRLILGQMLEALGHWQRAEEAYRQIPPGVAVYAQAQSALDRLAEKWHIYAKVRTLLLEEGPSTETLIGPEDRVLVKGPGWTIAYPLRAEPSLLKTMAKTLGRARRRLEETLGVVPEHLRVEVFEKARELHLSGPAPPEAFSGWAAGIYDGTIRIAVGRESLPEPPFLVLLLTHEVAHAAVEEASRGRCPAWLDEGIAQNLAQNLPRRAEARLLEAARKEALLPLKALEEPFWHLKAKPLIDLAYAQALSVVGFLEREVGWQGLRGLLEALASGLSPEEALADAGWPYWRLEASWQEELLARGEARASRGEAF